jgi:hypothetical protein
MKPIYKLLNWVPIHKLNFYELLKNPRAKYFLEENNDKLSYNFETINLLEEKIEKKIEENIEKIEWSILNDWIILSENIILPEPAELPVQLIEENVDKINWKIESRNPNIFELDYKQMCILRTEIFFQELMLKTWDRSRLCQCINMEDEIDIL